MMPRPAPPPLPDPRPAPAPRPATRTVADRWRWYRALAGLWLALWIVPLGLLVALTQGLDPLISIWIGVGLFAGLLAGVLWFALPLLQDVAAARAGVAGWWTDQAERRADGRVRREAWAVQPAPAPVVVQPERVIPVHHWGEPARVTPAPEPDAAVTQRLPPLRTGVPGTTVLNALVTGQRISTRHRPAGLSREGYEAQVAFLVEAGIVEPPSNRPLALAPRYRGMPEHVVWDDARRVAGVL
jgi:hypothetical protein